jgi:carbamoyl-phosphate synthase large subunit
MNTVLISGAGGDVGVGAIQIIREYQADAKIIGLDVNSENAAPLLCDEFVQAPPASSSQYFPFLKDTFRTFTPDVFIPTSDSEIVALCVQGIKEFPHTLLPNSTAVNVFRDKLTTFEYLQGIGLPVPWTIPLDQLQGNDQPVIVKPRIGRGSQGVFCIDSVADLPGNLNYADFIAQELLKPAEAEVTAAVYRSRAGEVRILQLRRKLVGGSTSWCEVIFDQEADQQIRSLAERLDLWGPINVQFMLTQDGPRIFEVNARLSSTILIRHTMGFTDLIWWLKELQAEDIQHWVPPTLGTVGVKVPTSMVSTPQILRKGQSNV